MITIVNHTKLADIINTQYNLISQIYAKIVRKVLNFQTIMMQDLLLYDVHVTYFLALDLSWPSQHDHKYNFYSMDMHEI